MSTTRDYHLLSDSRQHSVFHNMWACAYRCSGLQHLIEGIVIDNSIETTKDCKLYENSSLHLQHYYHRVRSNYELKYINNQSVLSRAAIVEVKEIFSIQNRIAFMNDICNQLYSSKLADLNHELCFHFLMTVVSIRFFSGKKEELSFFYGSIHKRRLNYQVVLQLYSILQCQP